MAKRPVSKRGWRRIADIARMLLFVAFGFGIASTGCLNDKCDNMKLVTSTDETFIDYCTPYKDTAPEPSDTTPPVDNRRDAGSVGDGGVVEGTECTVEADCPENEYCDLTKNPPICLPPPTGQGQHCETHADCAGFEANFCEAYGSFSCLVQNCDLELNNCSDEYMCCDFSWMDLPSLCVLKEPLGGVCFEM